MPGTESRSKGSSQIEANGVQGPFQTQLQYSNRQRVAELHAEIAALRRELLDLKQDKADLEILLEATAEHSDCVEAELHSTAIAALRRSEEWFRTIAEATPVPVLISRIDDGAVLYANTAAGLAFGVQVEMLLSQKIPEIYASPADEQIVLDAIRAGEHVQNVEFQCKRADDSLFWVAASFQQLTFNDELTVLAALCDITQRKRQEESLRRQVQEMQIEIDQVKLAHQVTEIVQSDYFQQLQTEIERFRKPQKN